VVIILYTVIFVIGAIIILWWSHSVVKRLDKLCNFIVNMPENEYKRVYIDDGDDEIYQLSLKIDDMRRTIVHDAIAKQAMLQNVSHDLKTPIAVIKSYAEAMEDGIEDISATQTIIEQCNKLEKKVKRFIEFNKLEYLSDEETNEYVLMKEVIIDVVHNYKHISHVKINVSLDDTVFNGRYENYHTICENIIENALRYAKEVINITLKDNVLTIYNDGKHIDKQFVSEGFKPHDKGSEGKIGLGMSIVCRTLDILNMKLDVKNEEVGVSFIITKKTI
jgi:two-component system sensor histidine kinase CssS